MVSGERRVAGIDLGKATAKLIVLAGAAQEVGELVEHDGDPLAAVRAWWARHELAGCAALGVTGLYAGELGPPALTGLPEDACVEAALAAIAPDGPVNVISVGARGYSAVVRAADGRIHSLGNDKCSSGTGETMVKIAGRFGLTIEQADELARAATASIPITARCSVFAKSEMTHFGNQGRPADALFRGYFASVAGYVAALLDRARAPGPVLLIGGCARIGALADALGAALGADVIVPERAQLVEALGAARLAVDHRGPALPAELDALVRARPRRFRALQPAAAAAGRVHRMQAAPPPPGAEREPGVLGIDLGSTGSKAVLTSIATGAMVLDLYDRTRGNPVAAAQGLIERVLAVAPDVRAIGLTGSGREAAATVLRAAYPERAAHIVVINEIVAHATAAIRCDERGGESLSVVEIGGQDAKFIQIAGGQIVESDMNKACSAGTGSFLEEQAVFYGVDDVTRFTELAQRAQRPPDLGQMCTVFVADAAAVARDEGFSVEDLFGGFQYSVIHNYINRVMGQRRFGDRVFFQGKPATGPSLAWTLAAVTGREVIVPPNPGAMGAWGIGLCAVEELGAEALLAAPAFDLRVALGAEIVGRGELQCRDARCATLCSIEKTTVAVGGGTHTVFAGGACPKFEVSTAARPKLPVDAPSAFDERAALLAPYLEEPAGGATVGVPIVGAIHGYVPWLMTLLRELGVPARALAPSPTALARGEARCHSFDACAPVKVAHGVDVAGVRALVFPRLIELDDPGAARGNTCPMEQGLPDMVRAALVAAGEPVDVIAPALFVDADRVDALVRELAPVAARLGVSAARVRPAVAAAFAAQRRHAAALHAIGERTLRYARAHGVPAVVMCGQLHVVHDRAINAGIPRMLRDHGVLAVSQDCYPVPQDAPRAERVAWADTNRALRVAVAARARGDVYPLMLTSFGCGPSSFVEQLFGAVLEGYPHTVLESDGHGGTAGFVTRVQAFLHAVRKHDRRGSRPARRRLGYLEPLPRTPVDADRDKQLVVLSIADRVGPLIASAYRAYGFDARASGPNTAESLALGRRDCSGKECLPYQQIWGSFRAELDALPTDREAVLLQVSGQGMCRNCMFSVKDQLSLERAGLSERVQPRHFGPEARLGPLFFVRVWAATTAWDLLHAMAAYHRPVERKAGEVDAIYERACDELEALIARPWRRGWRAAADVARDARAYVDLVDRAAAELAEVGARAADDPDRRTVLLSGDIYVRLDEHASDRLVRRLNDRGLRVLTEPISALSEYTAHERLDDLFGLPTEGAEHAVSTAVTRTLRRALYGRVGARHPWLRHPPVETVVAASRELIGRYPKGEAPVTVGNVLHRWRERACDGVVIASPWGCGPALVSESLLRHRRDIPMLFVYADGTPIDDRKLEAFAFRLRRAPARATA